MFKIQLAEGEFYKNTSSRVQHFSEEQGKAKIDKLGAIASGATLVECKARTAVSTKEVPKKIASDSKVLKSIKTKKAAIKSEKPASSKDKTKKNKKA
jgi:hypothetical protein